VGWWYNLLIITRKSRGVTQRETAFRKVYLDERLGPESQLLLVSFELELLLGFMPRVDSAFRNK
jgi:hypothetical protein